MRYGSLKSLLIGLDVSTLLTDGIETALVTDWLNRLEDSPYKRRLTESRFELIKLGGHAVIYEVDADGRGEVVFSERRPTTDEVTGWL